MKLRVSFNNLLSWKNTEYDLERNTYQKKLLKIAFKQTMWRVYKHTRKDEGYINYKETLYVTLRMEFHQNY